MILGLAVTGAGYAQEKKAEIKPMEMQTKSEKMKPTSDDKIATFDADGKDKTRRGNRKGG